MNLRAPNMKLLDFGWTDGVKNTLSKRRQCGKCKNVCAKNKSELREIVELILLGVFFSIGQPREYQADAGTVGSRLKAELMNLVIKRANRQTESGTPAVGTSVNLSFVTTRLLFIWMRRWVQGPVLYDLKVFEKKKEKEKKTCIHISKQSSNNIIDNSHQYPA